MILFSGVIQNLPTIVSGHSDHLYWPPFFLFCLFNCDSLLENTFLHTRDGYVYIMYQIVLFRLPKTWIKQLYTSCVHWVLFSSIFLCWLSHAFNQFHDTETWGHMWWIEKCGNLFTCFCCSQKSLCHQFSSAETKPVWMIHVLYVENGNMLYV